MTDSHIHTRQLSDRHPRLAMLERLWTNVVPLLALGLAFWAVVQIESEANERRDQNCLVFEGQYLTNVDRLKATYRYLETLPREDYGTNLTKAVLRGLKTQEETAREEPVPAYCDEPGVEAERAGEKPVGLPEPDPVVPPKKDFSDRAKRP